MEFKDGSVSIKTETIEEFEISDATKMLSHEEKIQKIKEYFQKEYQGKFVEYDKEGENIRVLTNEDTRRNYFLKKHGIDRKPHKTKLNLAADGKYYALISNVKYLRSSPEKKSEQSLFHNNTLQWHYFSKPILCDSIRFDVIIDVRENYNHKFSIHNISLRFPEKEKKRNPSIPGPNPNGRYSEYADGISSANIIPQIDENVNTQNGNITTEKMASKDSVETVKTKQPLKSVIQTCENMKNNQAQHIDSVQNIENQEL